MDFTADGADGLKGGGDNPQNTWFTFDLSEATKKYPLPEKFGESGIASNVRSFKELGSFCGDVTGTDGLPGLKSLLTPADPAWVSSVRVEMTSEYPVPADGGDPEQAVSPGVRPSMCYGYRTPDGVWHWNMTEQKSVWDSTKKLLLLTFQVQQGPVDGFKIFFNAGPVRYINRIILTTKPAL